MVQAHGPHCSLNVHTVGREPDKKKILKNTKSIQPNINNKHKQRKEGINTTTHQTHLRMVEPWSWRFTLHQRGSNQTSTRAATTNGMTIFHPLPWNTCSSPFHMLTQPFVPFSGHGVTALIPPPPWCQLNVQAVVCSTVHILTSTTTSSPCHGVNWWRRWDHSRATNQKLLVNGFHIEFESSRWSSSNNCLKYFVDLSLRLPWFTLLK